MNEKATVNNKNQIEIITAMDARIALYDGVSLLRMPTTGKYAGYTYYIFNDRINNSTQIADSQSNPRELAITLRINKNQTILIKNRATDDEIELLPSEFIAEVADKTSRDYIRTKENGETMWTTISVPREALIKRDEKSSQFITPDRKGIIKSNTFYVPNDFVSEDLDSDGKNLNIAVPDSFAFSLFDRKTGTKTQVSAYVLYKNINNVDVKYYDFDKLKDGYGKKSEAGLDNGGWNYVTVDKSAVIAEYDDATLMRMPKGEYEGYCYYIPNSLVKKNTKNGSYRISMPKDFVITLVNKELEEEDKQKINISGEDYIGQVKDKKTEDYVRIYKPSEEKAELFAATERQLRENVPKEMLDKPNWVIVRTRYVPEKDKYDKFLIDIHTGKFAESDNPETWATFDEAAKYAKENSGVTLAYALDGKDKICCIDLDHCIDDNDKMTRVAQQVIQLSDGCYCEKSVSGHGLHIFGKTDGLDLRAFSKDGNSEFYQKNHFIAMTGNVINGFVNLKSIDELPVRGYLLDHHDKRSDVYGAGKGLEGLSVLSDIDIVEKATASKGGDVFKALYDGQDLQNNHSNSDMALMARLAFWCNGDKEQMLRIFATSGLYRPNKSQDYYEHTVIKAIQSVTGRYNPSDSTNDKSVAKPPSKSNKDGK